MNKGLIIYGGEKEHIRNLKTRTHGGNVKKKSISINENWGGHRASVKESRAWILEHLGERF